MDAALSGRAAILTSLTVAFCDRKSMKIRSLVGTTQKRMPSLVDEQAYDGASRRIQRLGLTPLLDEVRELITGFSLLIEERRHANGAGILRELLDARFHAAQGWRITKSGGIDWQKCLELQPTLAHVCLGVEIQVSSRSDLLTNDLTHLMKAIEEGHIDVGIIVVPADNTARFLTDRCPSFSSAINHVDRAKGQFSPIMLLAIAHDGPGPPLKKKRTNLGTFRP